MTVNSCISAKGPNMGILKVLFLISLIYKSVSSAGEEVSKNQIASCICFFHTQYYNLF